MGGCSSSDQGCENEPSRFSCCHSREKSFGTAFSVSVRLPASAPDPSVPDQFEDLEQAGLEALDVPESLLAAIANIPWKAATLPASFAPISLKHFACSDAQDQADVDTATLDQSNSFTEAGGSWAAVREAFQKPIRKEWLALSGHDFVITRITDPWKGNVPLTANTMLYPGYRVEFILSQKATVRGYPPKQSDKAWVEEILKDMITDEFLRHDVYICRTDHAIRSGRVSIIGDNVYKVLAGSRLSSHKSGEYTFEYDPLKRFIWNFGGVKCLREGAMLSVLAFNFEAEKMRLGMRGEGVKGLDLRAKYGVNVLGIARPKESGKDSTQAGYQMVWCPPPNFEVTNDDLCLVLPHRRQTTGNLGSVISKHARLQLVPR